MSEIAARTPQQEVIAQIRSEDFRTQLAQALPEGVSVDRFARVTVTALLEDQTKTSDPAKQIINADRNSLFAAVVKCAQDGLLPNGHEAALVVFKGKVQYLPMIGGYRKIIGEYGWTLRTMCVREGDDFEWTDEPQFIGHRKGAKRGEPVYAYAIATHPVKGRQQLVMTREEVLKRRGVSKTDMVWNAWEDEMWEKTPGKALANDLPLDPSDKVRIERMIAAEMERGQAADDLYGPTSSEPAAIGSESGGQVEAPPHAASPADADTGDEEPGVSDEDGDANKRAVAVADEAAKYVPPTGKFSASGQHGPKTLGEILALGEDGAGWFKWAMAHVTSPPEYLGAVEAFARVYAEGLYQEAVARRELS